MVNKDCVSQAYDSTFYPTDSSAILFFHNKLDTYCPIELTPIDTTLMDFEAYNPLDKLYLFYASLGNVGLAYKNLDYSPAYKVGFDYGINTFNAYFFDQRDIKYYLNPRPYTEVGYVTGAKKEQLFSAKHYQRIFKRMAVGVDLDIINSLGTYQRQKSDDIKVAATLQFFTKDLRYGIVGNYNHSRVKARENGGILYDSVYEQDIETNRSILAVKLDGAQNVLRKSGVYFQQYFQLSGRKKSTFNDSLENDKRKIRIKFGRIAHSFNYSRNSLVFTDSKPGLDYYQNVYVDSTATYDSVFFQRIENAFSWSNSDFLDRLRPQPFVIQFGIKHEITKVQWYNTESVALPASDLKNGLDVGGQSDDEYELMGNRDVLMKSTSNYLIPYGNIQIRPHPVLNVSGNGSYILNGGDYQGDFNLNALATLEILRRKPYKTAFNFAFDLTNTAAPFFYRQYFSNHFVWDNDFAKVKIRKLSAFIVQRNTRVGVDVYKMRDYLYVGADTLPGQFDQSIEVFKAYLHQKFVVGKFDVDSRFVYQKVSEQDIIRLPEFMAYFTVTFNLRMFDGALHTRSGFDIYYFTKYYADAYMPAIRSYYIQNETEVGGYLHADFFLDFNVAKTRFFMKFQNILSPFTENRYYQVPHYPLQDFAFKFGLSWRFYD